MELKKLAFIFFQFGRYSMTLICQKNALWRVDELVSASKIVSREVAGNTGRITRQTGRPREIC